MLILNNHSANERSARLSLNITNRVQSRRANKYSQIGDNFLAKLLTANFYRPFQFESAEIFMEKNGNGRQFRLR